MASGRDPRQFQAGILDSSKQGFSVSIGDWFRGGARIKWTARSPDRRSKSQRNGGKPSVAVLAGRDTDGCAHWSQTCANVCGMGCA